MQFVVNGETLEYPVINVPLKEGEPILCAVVDRFTFEERNYAVMVEVDEQQELTRNLLFFEICLSEDGGADLNIIQDEEEFARIGAAYNDVLGLSY